MLLAGLCLLAPVHARICILARWPGFLTILADRPSWSAFPTRLNSPERPVKTGRLALFGLSWVVGFAWPDLSAWPCLAGLSYLAILTDYRDWPMAGMACYPRRTDLPCSTVFSQWLPDPPNSPVWLAALSLLSSLISLSVAGRHCLT
jgi:hypothetical protein